MIRNRIFEVNGIIPLFFQIQARNGVKTKTGIGKYNKMELNSELIAELSTGFRQGVELRI
ncbi:hypothetical protein KJ966_22455 [bacterium]|nr:hypothetical protein [bacterium]